jgi:hypothetical protein
MVSDRPARRTPLEEALDLSDAILEAQMGVPPGTIHRLVEEELAGPPPAQDAPGAPVVPAAASGIVQPIKAPAPGVPRRPIDDATWEGAQFRPRVEIRVEGGVSYEIEPCPRWMRPGTYRWLLARLRQGMAETPELPLDHLHAWAARHVWVVWEPPRLVSGASPADLIGPALEFVRQARRHGFTNADLALPRKRRLLG